MVSQKKKKKKVKSSGLKLNIINLHFTYTNRNAHATHQPNEIKLRVPQVEFLGVDLFDWVINIFKYWVGLSKFLIQVIRPILGY